MMHVLSMTCINDYNLIILYCIGKIPFVRICHIKT